MTLRCRASRRWSFPGCSGSLSTQATWTFILTHQPLPTIDRSKYAPASGLQKSAYILADEREEGVGLADLLDKVEKYQHREMDPIEGALVEP